MFDNCDDITWFDFHFLRECHFFTVTNEESALHSEIVNAVVVFETTKFQPNIRMLLLFSDVKDVLIRRVPGYIETESFILVDIDYERKYVTPRNRCITEEERERNDIRFSFGEWQHDPWANMFFYAWDVRILSFEPITKCASGPILANPEYSELLRSHERWERPKDPRGEN